MWDVGNQTDLHFRLFTTQSGLGCLSVRGQRAWETLTLPKPLPSTTTTYTYLPPVAENLIHTLITPNTRTITYNDFPSQHRLLRLLPKSNHNSLLLLLLLPPPDQNPTLPPSRSPTTSTTILRLLLHPSRKRPPPQHHRPNWPQSGPARRT